MQTNLLGSPLLGVQASQQGRQHQLHTCTHSFITVNALISL